MRWIDYGLGGLEAARWTRSADGQATSPISTTSSRATRRLFGFEATERFYEIGTPDALAETGAFLLAHGAAAPITAGRPTDPLSAVSSDSQTGFVPR